jgi:hypothetical protein
VIEATTEGKGKRFIYPSLFYSSVHIATPSTYFDCSCIFL